LDRRTHGGLEVNLSNVLPLLLEKRRQKVGSKLGVDADLLDIHGNVANRHVQAHDLLHLKFDGRLELVNLLLHVIRGPEQGRELSSLGQTRSKQTRNLLDQVVGRQEKVILLGEFLDKLLVLVELLQVFDTHVVDPNALGLLAMRSVSKHTALELGTRNRGQLESATETLVTNRVVVLEGNLRFNRFREVALLSLLGHPVDLDVFAAGKLHDAKE
jgi:hypothetical protein